MNEIQQIWYVWQDGLLDHGLSGVEFVQTKLDAEALARYMFPNESEDQRYARIKYVRVYKLGA